MAPYKHPLGSTQRTILAYVASNPGLGEQAIGDALYEATSNSAKVGRSTPRLRKNWAGRIVRQLLNRGLIRCDRVPRGYVEA